LIRTRKPSRERTPILVINLLLGWTFVGWVVALVGVGAYPPLVALLERQLASSEPVSSPWVFHHHGKPIPYETWNDTRKRATTAANVEAITHDLRRTAVRNLERAGVSRSVAMSLTGHKTEAVYRRYAIVDSSAQREGVAKLAAAANGHKMGTIGA